MTILNSSLMVSMSAQPAEQMWSRLWAQMVPTAKNLTDLVRQMQNVWIANPEVAALIAASIPGEGVGQSGLSAEQAAAVAQLGQAMATFLSTPVVEGGLTPLQIVYRCWAAPTSGEESPV